jgi:nucleotide-binding universal stress UspA family protein
VILLTVDTSPESETATPVAATLAQRFNSPVTVLMVLDGPLRHHFDELSRHTSIDADELVDSHLHTVATSLRDAGVEQVSTAYRHAVEASTGILEAIDDTPNLALVVMATHGRSGLSWRLAGSVTEHVVRSSSVPIVVVPVGAPPIEGP